MISIRTAILFTLFTVTGVSGTLECEELTCSNDQACYTSQQHCDGVKHCSDGSDELQCNLAITTVATSSSTNPFVIWGYGDHESRANFAWLVTPAVFALGVIYAVYKCIKEGICLMRRNRRQPHMSGDSTHSSTSNYLAFDRMSFFALTPIPCSHLRAGNGLHQPLTGAQRLMMVHNRSIALRLPNGHVGLSRENLPPPSYDEAMTNRHRGTSFRPLLQDVQEDPELPAYDEALNLIAAQEGTDSLESTRLPTESQEAAATFSVVSELVPTSIIITPAPSATSLVSIPMLPPPPEDGASTRQRRYSSQSTRPRPSSVASSRRRRHSSPARRNKSTVPIAPLIPLDKP